MSRVPSSMFQPVLAACLIALLAAAPRPAAAEEGAWPLVFVTTEEGTQRLFGADLKGDYVPLVTYMVSEEVVTFCGPATVTIVANSLGLPAPESTRWAPYHLWTEDELFEAAGQKPKIFGEVMSVGLTLAERGQFIENVGMTPEVHFASDLSEDSFRDLVKATLADPRKRLIVNYDRQEFGEIGTGHISPIGAYDAATDSVLILDVARYKYPPKWVPLAGMLAAMMHDDPSSQKSRGTVVISLPES